MTMAPVRFEVSGGLPGPLEPTGSGLCFPCWELFTRITGSTGSR